MVKFATSVAFVALTAALVASPASAERNWGPLQQNGKCWQSATGPHATMGYGYWGDCPQAASARTTQLRHPLRARRDPHSDR